MVEVGTIKKGVEKIMDWDNFVKVFDLPINDIKVKKEVSKADVIMSLMSEGDIAFKFKDNQMVMKISEIRDLKLLKLILWKPIEDYVNRKKELEK